MKNFNNEQWIDIEGGVKLRDEANIWDRFSFVYDIVMKKDNKAYGKIIDKIKANTKPDYEILEIATGTGDIALGLSDSAERISAVDFSAGMIEKAKREALKQDIGNVVFSIQDAACMDFEPETFDTVIISNTLHIMPKPEKTMDEIKRVLKSQGRLIAPTFINGGKKKAEMVSKIMAITGFRAYNLWTFESYKQFIESNGFSIDHSEILNASFPIAYIVASKTEAKKHC